MGNTDPLIDQKRGEKDFSMQEKSSRR